MAIDKMSEKRFRDKLIVDTTIVDKMTAQK